MVLLLVLWLLGSPGLSPSISFSSGANSGFLKQDGGLTIISYGTKVWECDPYGHCGGLL